MTIKEHSEKLLKVALAGNANVGKSVIFNQLTGLHQHVGNWPGKTVERAEGTLQFGEYTIDILDLPGIYSLSTYSIEEQVSREYIAVERPDVLIDVVDAAALERNLFFTLQLLELEPRMVLALNQVDAAERKGIHVDPRKLSTLLDVPVVPTVGTKNIGLAELITHVIDVAGENPRTSSSITYGREAETCIETLVTALQGVESPYPRRWLAIKVLENDEEVTRVLETQQPAMKELGDRVRRELAELHGHDAPSVVASERYAVASHIAREVTTHRVPTITVKERVERATMHSVLGYVIMATVMLAIFYSIFVVGEATAGLLDQGFSVLKAAYESVFSGILAAFVWQGVVEGVYGGVTIALPYIIPFYLALSLLEDSGYLARIAYLMDAAMHKIGLHGKGFIPLMLGFGCTVPACLGCRIMETRREQLICAFVTSLVPCSARTIVIMGMVARYVGFEWALALYVLDFALIFAIGRLAFTVVPGEPVGLIMEIPSFKWPTLRVTASRTWVNLKGFVHIAFPIMIFGNLAIHIAHVTGVLTLVQGALMPITMGWLGLPAVTGVVLIFGVLRKELTLTLLASLVGTSNLALVLSPTQMFVFAFVVMIYIPCLATIATLAKEFGYRVAAMISALEIGLAVTLGGLLFRIVSLIRG